MVGALQQDLLLGEDESVDTTADLSREVQEARHHVLSDECVRRTRLSSNAVVTHVSIAKEKRSEYHR